MSLLDASLISWDGVCLQKTAKDITGMQKDSFSGAFFKIQNSSKGVMWMRTSGQMQKMKDDFSIYFIYLFICVYFALLYLYIEMILNKKNL